MSDPLVKKKFQSDAFDNPYTSYLNAHLHCGENRTKLVHLKEQKKYFAILKSSNLAGF
jgi:hypothetical protein